MTIIYRFGNFAAQNVVDLKKNTSYMYRPMPAGDSVLSVTPSDDIAAWCARVGVDPMDNSFTALSISAVAEQSTANQPGEAQFAVANLGLPRLYSGQESRDRINATRLRVFKDMPFLTMRAEEAGDTTHTCRYGETAVTYSDYDNDPRASGIWVRSKGGVTTLNHPFGVARSFAALTAKLYNKVVTNLHRINVGEADNIEIYNARATDMEGHLALADGLLIAGHFLGRTSSGDDHDGNDDGLNPNATDLYTTSEDEAGYIDAMARGEMSVIDYQKFPAGSIWCGVDDQPSGVSAPMGSVLYNPSGRDLNYMLQIGGLGTIASPTVEIRTAPITWQLGSGLPPVTKYRALAPGDFDPATGILNLQLPASQSCFYYAVVKSGSTIVGVGNPISSIKRLPTAAEPAIRQERLHDISQSTPRTPAALALAA